MSGVKESKKIYNSLSNKGVIKFRRTINKQPVSLDNESGIKSLYPGFIFKERDRTS